MKQTLFLALSLLCLTTAAHAGWVVTDGRLMNENTVATGSFEEHLDAMLQAAEVQDDALLLRQADILLTSYKNDARSQLAYYYQGVACFNTAEFAHANKAFSRFLASPTAQQAALVESCFAYKFAIAEKYAAGAKRRAFNTKLLPKLMSGFDDALDIYDEVLAALPLADLAAESLFSKGKLLALMELPDSATEAFNDLIRRFPKHEKCPLAYVEISKVYVQTHKNQPDNPYTLSLAELNLRKFETRFPSDENLAAVRADCKQLKESFACGLFETGRFYERKGYPKAACLYYKDLLHRFGDTTIAQRAQQRLASLQS